MIALLVTAAIILAAIASWALVHGGTRKPTPQSQYDYAVRYKGGDAPCIVCGQWARGYTLHGRPICPECREAS